MFEHHDDSSHQLSPLMSAGGRGKPARASPVRMSHDLYFRPDDATPNAGGGLFGRVPPAASHLYRGPSDPRGEDGPRRSHLWPTSSSHPVDVQQRGHPHPQQHAQNGVDQSSSSLEEGPLENVFLPTTQQEVPSRHTNALHQQPPQPTRSTADGGFGADNASVHSAGGGGRSAHEKDMAAANRSAFADLKVENRNLRMRLMYMDEIMAKRNIQGTLVNDLADARQELDMLRRELTEAQRQHDLLRKEFTNVVADRDSLQDRSEQLERECKKLGAIPSLEAALRGAEIERDDAVTKVLTLQLDANSDRQAFVEQIKGLQEELDGLRQTTEAALATREDQMIADRMSHQHRIQQLTNEFDAVKADLRAMLEQRSDALHQKEREVDVLRGAVVAAETNVTVAERTLDEKNATIDALQREMQDADLRQRRLEMEHQDGCYDRDKRVVALETQVRETEKILASCDDMLVVYKRALQYSMDLLKRPDDMAMVLETQYDASSNNHRAMSPITASRGGGGGATSDAVPFLLSPIMAERVSASLLGGGETASSPARSPHRTPVDAVGSNGTTEQPRVTSSAAIVMASVLKSAIDDAAKHAHHERRRELFTIQDRIQRQLGGFQSMLEGLHDVHMTKVRRMSNRIAESCDLTELCTRRQLKLKQRHREEVATLNHACERAEEALVVCRQHLSNAADEHAAVVAELRRLTADRDLERTALTFVSSMEELSNSVKGTLKHAADEMRGSIVPVNVITPDFLEGIRTLVRKAHQSVHGLHDVIEIAQRQYHSYVMDQSGGAGQSSSSSSPLGGDRGRTPGATALYPTGRDAGINSSRSVGGFTRSPSSTAGGGDGSISKSALTVENLVHQLVNVCVLLENNVSQSQQSQLKFQSALEGWEQGLVRQWHALETRIADSMLPLRQRYLSGGSQPVPSPRLQVPQPTMAHSSAMGGGRDVPSTGRTASASPPTTAAGVPGTNAATLTTHALPQNPQAAALRPSTGFDAPLRSTSGGPSDGRAVHWQEYLLQTQQHTTRHY